MRNLLNKIAKGFTNALSSFSLYPAPIRLEEINPAYSERNTPNQRDASALTEDWNKIGRDMQRTLEDYRSQ